MKPHGREVEPVCFFMSAMGPLRYAVQGDALLRPDRGCVYIYSLAHRAPRTIIGTGGTGTEKSQEINIGRWLDELM